MLTIAAWLTRRTECHGEPYSWLSARPYSGVSSRTSALNPLLNDVKRHQVHQDNSILLHGSYSHIIYLHRCKCFMHLFMTCWLVYNLNSKPRAIRSEQDPDFRTCGFLLLFYPLASIIICIYNMNYMLGWRRSFWSCFPLISSFIFPLWRSILNTCTWFCNMLALSRSRGNILSFLFFSVEPVCDGVTESHWRPLAKEDDSF